MVLANRTRLAKRKLEIQEVRKENQTSTSKKHDKTCLGKDKKLEKDSDSLLKELNDALLEEVKLNEKAIAILEGKEKKYIAAVKSLEEMLERLRMETSPKSNSDLETQTLLDSGESDLQIPCRICIYMLLHVRRSSIGTWMMNMVFKLICIVRQIFLVRFVQNGAELRKI